MERKLKRKSVLYGSCTSGTYFHPPQSVALHQQFHLDFHSPRLQLRCSDCRQKGMCVKADIKCDVVIV